jgi:hypothetical protein
MERQRNAPASREKDNVFSFYLEGNQGKEDKQPQES